jgi:hypothetical protein
MKSHYKFLVFLVLLSLIPSASSDTFIGNNIIIPGFYNGLLNFTNVSNFPATICTDSPAQYSRWNGTGFACFTDQTGGSSYNSTYDSTTNTVNNNLLSWNSTYNTTYQNNTKTLLSYFNDFLSTYNSSYDAKSNVKNLSDLTNLSNISTVYSNYTRTNGVTLISNSGHYGNMNQSFISDSFDNGAEVYQAHGVTSIPLFYNTVTGGLDYYTTRNNTFGITLTRAGSILHTTQTNTSTGTNTSTLRQDGTGWNFDWGLFNSTLGRRDNRITIDTRTDPLTGTTSGLNMTGQRIINSPDLSRIDTTGVISGGNLTFDPITSNITIGSGRVLLRDTNSESAQLREYVFFGKNVTVPLKTTRFVYVIYNGTGIPYLNTTSNFGDIDGRTAVHLYQIHQENSTIVHYIDARLQNVGSGLKLRRMLYETDRFNHGSGAVIGNPSGLNLSITNGTFYYGLNKINTFARNTATGSTIEVYRRVANLSYIEYFDNKVNNTYYDNNGVITALNNNKYKVDWIYLILSSDAVMDGEFAMVLGQNQWNSLAEAQVEPVPSSLPQSVSEMGVIVGKVIVQKAATNISQLDSAFLQQFTPSIATDHNGLAGLQGGTTNEYYHLTSVEYSNLGYNSTYDSKLSNSSMDRKLSNFTNDLNWVNNTTSDKYNVTYQNTTGTVLTYFNQFMTTYNATYQGLITSKEDTISTSTNNVFWNGLKQWISLTYLNITGFNSTVQSIVDIGGYVTNTTSTKYNVSYQNTSGTVLTYFNQWTNAKNTTYENTTIGVTTNFNSFMNTYNSSYSNGGFSFVESNGTSNISICSNCNSDSMRYNAMIIKLSLRSISNGTANVSIWTYPGRSLIGWINMTNYNYTTTSLSPFSVNIDQGITYDIQSISNFTRLTIGIYTTRT